MVKHDIMLKKLQHLGLNINAVNFINSYLSDRKQSIFFNGFHSKLKNIGTQSCFQATITATLLYILYTLDQPAVVHINCPHQLNVYSISTCDRKFSQNYIDDNHSEVQSNTWTELKYEAESFLNNQLEYHNNNKLVLNYDKTVIMFNSKKKRNRLKIINFKEKKLKHHRQVVALGMIYNDNLNFSDHIVNGTQNKNIL